MLGSGLSLGVRVWVLGAPRLTPPSYPSQEQAAKAALQAEIQTLRQIRPELGDAPPRVPQAPS